MNTIYFKLSGLTCEACSKLISSRVKKIPGVQEVNVNQVTGDSEVISTGHIDLDLVAKSLEGTPYKIVK
ncbi:MAG: heavy-metal-associated domain-containing protein [Patescibacteria group bacterium]